MAILAAVQECQFRVLEVLFKWDANPAHLTINQGDTPIHAALSIALERDKGKSGLWVTKLQQHIFRHQSHFLSLHHDMAGAYGVAFFNHS